MQLGTQQHSVLCGRKQLRIRKPLSRLCEQPQVRTRKVKSQACRKQNRSTAIHTKATAEAATEARPSGLTPFAAVRSEEEFFGALQKGVDSGKLPKPLYAAFEDFYNNYKQTVLGSDAPDASPELVARVMGSIADRTFNQFLDPYTFPSYHTRLLEPYDYYKFGQNYVRTLINFNKSVVGHLERFEKIQEQLDAGDNVVLLANHQTEADPGVWALLLEKKLPHLATEIIYVAGDADSEICVTITPQNLLLNLHFQHHATCMSCALDLLQCNVRPCVFKELLIWFCHKLHAYIAWLDWLSLFLPWPLRMFVLLHFPRLCFSEPVLQPFYIAGDRVVADPLCKPFSMGRNLFCVHSRKRMDDIPELKSEKMVCEATCANLLH